MGADGGRVHILCHAEGHCAPSPDVSLASRRTLLLTQLFYFQSCNHFREILDTFMTPLFVLPRSHSSPVVGFIKNFFTSRDGIGFPWIPKHCYWRAIFHGDNWGRKVRDVQGTKPFDFISAFSSTSLERQFVPSNQAQMILSDFLLTSFSVYFSIYWQDLLLRIGFAISSIPEAFLPP